MLCFQKIKRPPKKFLSGSAYSSLLTSFKKDVEDGVDSVKTIIQYERISSKLYADRSDIPESDNYLLREMLKQGYVPNEINVSGMFNSNDPLSSENVDFVDKNYAAMQENVESSKSE